MRIEAIQPLIVISAFILGDIVTGLLAAFATKSFKSSAMRTGAWHKVAEIMGAFLMYGIQYSLPIMGVESNIKFVTVYVVYIVIMEVGSMIENLAKIDPDLKGPLKKLYNSMKGVLNNGDSSNDGD